MYCAFPFIIGTCVETSFARCQESRFILHLKDETAKKALVSHLDILGDHSIGIPVSYADFLNASNRHDYALLLSKHHDIASITL